MEALESGSVKQDIELFAMYIDRHHQEQKPPGFCDLVHAPCSEPQITNT